MQAPVSVEIECTLFDHSIATNAKLFIVCDSNPNWQGYRAKLEQKANRLWHSSIVLNRRKHRAVRETRS